MVYYLPFSYIVRRSNGMPVAGIFMPINTLSFAERIKEQWQHNCPDETFYIEKVE